MCCLSQVAPAAAADFAGQAGPLEAGPKRLWGELAADDVTVVDSMPASSMLWGSTRPRLRRTRPSSAEAAAAAAAAAMGTPIVILDDDSPAPLSNSMKQQQQHLPGPQGHSNRRAVTPRRLNPISSPPMRPSSISANPSIANVGSLAQAAPQAAAPAARRRAMHRAAAAAAPRAAQAAGQRRNSNSSSSSAEQVDGDADALLARKLAQEEEDRVMAQRLMQEEEQQAQV